jgi:beta-lactamase class D
MQRIGAWLLTMLMSPALLAEDAQIAALLERENLKGTLVIASLHGGQRFVHDEARASRRYPAASTFKVANTLIALQEGVVTGPDSPFTWDGTRYSIANWNRDQTLESAFRVSCVWCYQQLARQIGSTRYREILHTINYGELHEPFALTTFWLDGSLSISAGEQVAFLKQVYQRSLPFSATAYDTLQQIMLSKRGDTFAIYAKTGLAGDGPGRTGWYIGYVEAADDIWFFASNLDISDDRQLPLRLSIVHEALQAKGILD